VSERAPWRRRRRLAAIVANAVLALSVVVVPWYALAAYTPSGWQATWLARLALVLALAGIVLLRLGRPPRDLLAPSLLALVLVAYRVALPPDFGFDLDGLEVPVERRPGALIALASAVAAFGVPLSVELARRSRRSGSTGRSSSA